jgi:YVTN family beta-propeller protein
VRELNIADAPAGLVVSPDNQLLYVANRDSNDVAIIDTASLKIKQRITVGKHPYGIALSTSGLWLALVNVQDDSVSLINTTTQVQLQFKVGYHPYCVAFSMDDKTLYVTNTQDDSVTVIDITSQKTIATIAVGNTPEGISLDDKYAYVANWGSSNVSVIDLHTNKVVATIKTGEKSRAFGQFILSQ